MGHGLMNIGFVYLNQLIDGFVKMQNEKKFRSKFRLR